MPLSMRSHGGARSHDGKRGDRLKASGNSGCRLFFTLSPLIAGLLIVLAAGPARAQSERTVPSLRTIVERMAQARALNRAKFRPYVVTRQYTLYGKEEDKVKSQVTADVAFDPPNLKKYAIEESVGSGLGEKAVRRILESEAEAAKDYDATDYSPANYEFRYLRYEQDGSGQRSYVLEMIPKREDKKLLRGMIWVDAGTYRIHRFEGEPAKSSSWWVRDVQMVFLYSDVEGMWLQTSTEATARVRILGPHRLVSSDVNYQISPPVATRPSDQTNWNELTVELSKGFQKPILKYDPSLGQSN